MTTATEQPDLAQENRFDLIVRLPDPVDIDALMQSARQHLGLDQAKSEQLVQHMMTHGASRVRREVSFEEAEKVAANFRAAGFQTEIKAVLALMAKEASSETSECPGCQRMMRPTPQRQCPYCFIYLDKIDRDKLRLKQIRDEELRKLNARLQREDDVAGRQRQEDSERALRNRIRAELEREMGLHQPLRSFFRGGRGVLRAGIMLGLLGVSFWGGHKLGQAPGELNEQQQAMLAQGMMGKIMAAGMGKPLDMEAFAQSPAGAALVAGSEDSLLTAAQANVAGGAEWQGVQASVQKAGSQQQATLGDKQRLAMSLVTALAQAGQAQRAGELLSRLQAAPGYSPALTQADEILATVSLLVQRPGGVGKAELDEQAALLAKLPPQQAAPLAARIAAILAASPALPPAYWQAWLDKAQQQWQAMAAGVVRDYAGSQVQRWQGQAMLNALVANAGKGRLQAARQQLDALQQWRAANPGLVGVALSVQAAVALGDVAGAEQGRQQLASQAMQLMQGGDPALQLQGLAEHLGDIDVSGLLPQLAALVPAQAASLQPVSYSSLALLAAAGGQAAATATFQQQVAAGLGSSEGRDAQVLALSVACTTQLARFYQQGRQPALAEQQWRKAAAVVVPLLPAAKAAA